MVKLLWLKEEHPNVRRRLDEALALVPDNYDETYVLVEVMSDLGWVGATIEGEARLENIGTLDVALYRPFID